MPSMLMNRLSNHEVLLHYAPLHSMLAEWGKPLEVHLSQWVIDHPDAYQDALVRSYAAGCDLASTSTQAASPWRAEVFGLRDMVHELNYKSAALARQVTPPSKVLCGFVSSTNPDFLEPVGDLTYQEVYDGYKEQISALFEGGVDAILIAGNQLDVNCIAIKVAKDLADAPVICQNVYYIGAAGYRTMMGFDPREGTRRVFEAGADVAGGSCGLMMEHANVPGRTHYYEGATELVKLMRQGAEGPISIQPNAGMAQLLDGETNYPASPAEMAAEVGRWIEAGAKVVGGCCGTTLAHYEAIAPVVRAYNASDIHH